MSTLVPWIDELKSISTRLGPGLSASIQQTPLPRMYHVRQCFPRPLVEDVSQAVREEFARPAIAACIRPGQRVCLLAGSRGINQIGRIVRSTVDEVRRLGGEPYIIPAMGSHGGATSAGQLRVLADYGITPERMGAPIVSNIEAEVIGAVLDMPVYAARDALDADVIIPIGRIKPHTGFRGPVESGLIKMLTIGLGKQMGADTLHAQGMERFGELLPAAADLIIQRLPVALGLAIVENGYDEPAQIEAVLGSEIAAREPELLEVARSLMPSIPFKSLHVLVIQAIGKNISGSGMDPNVCGRFVRSNGPAYSDIPEVQHVAVLDLTPETHGNAAGIGLGDLMTLRVLQKLDLPATYANCMTASHLAGAMIPVVMENDRTCIQAAIKTATRCTPGTLRMVLIHSTLEVGEIWISEALLEEARAQPHLEIAAAPTSLEFDADGNIIAPITCKDK